MGLFWPTVPGYTIHHGRELMQEELEVADYIVSTVRKQEEMNVSTQLSLSLLYPLGSLPRERS